MGKGEPVKVTPFRQTSMGNKTVTVDGQTVAARQTVASLPSDYKQTEAREFAKAAAFQQAKKNPNVTTSLDSKGQVVVKPVQRGRGESGTSDRTAQGNQARVQQNAKARAQAAAIQRKISGKSISQTKAANKAAVRKSAAERQAAFKKTRKSTVGARRAAAKAKVKAAAKKRHSAFKKKRKARKKSKKGKK
jgi:histone H1/5